MTVWQTGFTRRRFLAASAGFATAFELKRAAWALGLSEKAEVCRLGAEQEVGPFYVADEMIRGDVSEGKLGVPLALKLMVLDARTCKPLANAAVDLWHCDAAGLYSGYTAQNPVEGMGPGGRGGLQGPRPGEGPPPDFGDSANGPPPPPGGRGGGPPQMKPTDKLTFLRGIQMTGADGSVSFGTVFPGFYMGRTNHIHFKVRVGGEIAGKTYQAGHISHVGQVFFPEELCVELMQHEPYNLHKIHRTTQAEDGIFQGQHGAASIAKIEMIKAGGSYRDGMRAELVATVDPTATPAPVGIGPGGRAPRPGGPGA